MCSGGLKKEWLDDYELGKWKIERKMIDVATGDFKDNKEDYFNYGWWLLPKVYFLNAES